MEPLCTDLRKWKAGGWPESRILAKVNGRWTYFYQETDQEPMNTKEPITFGAKYTPPNHVDDKTMPYATQNEHPVRLLYLQKHQHSKAPFVYETKGQHRVIPPVWEPPHVPPTYATAIPSTRFIQKETFQNSTVPPEYEPPHETKIDTKDAFEIDEEREARHYKPSTNSVPQSRAPYFMH